MQTNKTEVVLKVTGTCPACKGKKAQRSTLDGLLHVCPSCEGTGVYAPVAKWPQFVPIYVPQPLNPAPTYPTYPQGPWITYCQTTGNVTNGLPNGSKISN